MCESTATPGTLADPFLDANSTHHAISPTVPSRKSLILSVLTITLSIPALIGA